LDDGSPTDSILKRPRRGIPTPCEVTHFHDEYTCSEDSELESVTLCLVLRKGECHLRSTSVASRLSGRMAPMMLLPDLDDTGWASASVSDRISNVPLFPPFSWEICTTFLVV